MSLDDSVEESEQLDGVVDFLVDWEADSDDGDLPAQPTEDESQQPEPEPEVRDGPGSRRQVRRVSVCLGLAVTPHSSFEGAEAAARRVEWSERALCWFDSKPPSPGCGFASKDMYTEFAKELQEMLQALPDWLWLDSSVHVADEAPADYLVICCSLQSPKNESPHELATELLQHLRTRLPGVGSGASAVCAARVFLVSEATKIPLMALSRGLESFVVSESQDADAVSFAAQLLDDAGMCVMTDAVTDDDVVALARLAMVRTAQIERALASADTSGKLIGSGDVTFAEICSRGVQRWDMLLHPPEQPLPVTGKDAAEQAMVDAGFEVLKNVATNGPWVAALEAALGLSASGYKWQAAIICSRPVRVVCHLASCTSSQSAFHCCINFYWVVRSHQVATLVLFKTTFVTGRGHQRATGTLMVHTRVTCSEEKAVVPTDFACSSLWFRCWRHAIVVTASTSTRA